KEWKLRYAEKDGFVGNAIPLVRTVDSSGRMWVGTSRGVVRREGERFVPVLLPDGTPLGETDDALAETDGTSWFASSDRGIVRWGGEQRQPAPVPPAFAGNQAHRIQRDAEGQIWIGTTKGVLRWDAVSTNFVDGGIGEGAAVSHRDTEGNWWVGGSALE